MSNRQKPSKIDYSKLDPGIRRYVKIIRDAGIQTLTSCEGRNNPGYHPEIDGPHSGDWPYILIQGAAAQAYIAVGAALIEGLPVRTIEQWWDIYPEDTRTLMGPHWRMTFWEKDKYPDE